MLNTSKILMVLTFLIFGGLFFHLGNTMLTVREDGYYVGHVNQYGDLVFHLGLISKFAETESVIISSPIYATTRPNYPIFADFITAQASRIIGVDFALLITTCAGGLLVILLSRSFIKKFTKSESVVFLSLLIFFAGGGLGFVYAFQDFFSANQSFSYFITHLPREYTDIKDQGYWWINSLLAYFLPQRGFLFAFPITLLVLITIYKGLEKNKRILFALSGLLTGSLAVIQSHSILVLFILLAFYAPLSLFVYKKRWKNLLASWSLYGFSTLVTILPLFRIISTDQNILSFIRFDPGWTSKENLLIFWFKNLGFLIPLLLLSIVWVFKKNLKLFVLYIPFLLIFIISNLFIFQPWEFDNSKLMIYWFFASSILIAYYLNQTFFKGKFYFKILGTIFVFLVCFSGSIDLFRTFTQVSYYKIFDTQDLEIANKIKSITDKNSLFVTSSVHNNPITALAGRTTYVGYHGWLWSHGISYENRVSEVERIYKGSFDADYIILNNKIDYVLIGPHEVSEFEINENYFKKFTQINLVKGWNLYDVNNLRTDSNR